MGFSGKLSWSVLLFFTIVQTFGIGSHAAESDKQPYVSGKEMMSQNPEVVKSENGFIVAVPKDYSDLSKGTTNIYAHFRKPYDPQLPTYVLFTGGPGQASHFPTGKADQYAELGYNFLLFDQRGIAFSRPDEEKDWKDPNFHSSENNARDLEEIRKFLKLDKLSVYGASYGTVPATIYGNLFPLSTRSVVLEGVVFDGFDKTPQRDNLLLNITQEYFNSLPFEVREKLNRISNDILLPKMWFPAYVNAYLMYSGTSQLSALTENLSKATLVNDGDFLPEFNRLISEANKKAIMPKSFDEDLVNILLLSKEFGLAREDVITQLVLENGKIVRKNTGPYSMYVAGARELGMTAGVASTYKASDYPLSVPVYYIQGARDGATTPAWAIKHWKSVPRGNAYLFILKGGGHMPGGQILKFDNLNEIEPGPQAHYFFQNLFKKMLNGDTIVLSDVEKLNQLGLSKAAFTSRASIRCNRAM